MMPRSNPTVSLARLIVVWPLFVAATLNAADGQSYDEPKVTDEDRDHWSFQPIVRVCPPAVKQGSWPENSIDRFVLDSLEQVSLSPAPQADRATWLRRLKFDLQGLPPTREEIISFQADTAVDADARLVDRLLASPAYGERWAQHWLDLARFAESDGFEHDLVRGEAWRYRQWVVDALNDDMPYHRFIESQIAGDLIDSGADAIATVFCMSGPDMPDINEQDLRRHDRLNELTSTIGASLLGLQLHCCQCHDHKYDPISIGDFYRVRTIFEGAIPELKRGEMPITLARQPAPLSPRIYHRGEIGHPGQFVKPRPPRIVRPVPDEETFDSGDPRQAFVRWLFHQDNPLTARVIANRVWQHHFGDSLCENPNDFGIVAAGPSHPELLDWLATEFRDQDWSLKRLHRVIVLSAAYRQASYCDGESEISAKHFARSVAKDPDNDFLSRFPRRRLEGETLRDALLCVSGQLNTQYGGPSVMPPLPPELLSTLLKDQWRTSNARGDHVRRSIYVFARRNLRYPMFEAFDRPDAGATCGRRDRSTTAIQSLLMLNGDFTFEAARQLRDVVLRPVLSSASGEEVQPAARVNLTAGQWHESIDRLYFRVLGRAPTDFEMGTLADWRDSSDRGSGDALLLVCVALLNSNEFLYID